MAIRKRRDGTYVIRYYADGTKRSAQRQETLRGVSYAEAARIYKQRLAAASARRGNAGASDRLTFRLLAVNSAAGTTEVTRHGWINCLDRGAGSR